MTRPLLGGTARAPGGRAALLLAPLLALLLVGCGVQQRVVLEVDGSGSTSLAVTLDASFVEYLRALAEVGGGDLLPDDHIFDTDEIAAAIATRPGVELIDIATPTANGLSLQLVFADVEAAFAVAAGDGAPDHPQGPPLVSLSPPSPRGRTLHIHLSADNYWQLARLFPSLDNPLMASLGPQPQMPITDGEYLEMMQFALGDQAPGQLVDSWVEVEVAVAGEVVAQEGGELTDGGVLFRIPLLRILVLDEPLDYAVTFR